MPPEEPLDGARQELWIGRRYHTQAGGTFLFCRSSPRSITDLERSHAELRVALILAGKEITLVSATRPYFRRSGAFADCGNDHVIAQNQHRQCGLFSSQPNLDSRHC
jgi:hypothetical protein